MKKLKTSPWEESKEPPEDEMRETLENTREAPHEETKRIARREN